MTEDISDTAAPERELLEQVVADLEPGRQDALSQALEEVHPAEVADLLESLPPAQRSDLWDAVPADQEGEVLSYLHEEARASIIEEMDHQELVAATESLAPEDLAEIVETLPEAVTNALLLAMDADHRERVELVLNYEDHPRPGAGPGRQFQRALADHQGGPGGRPQRPGLGPRGGPGELSRAGHGVPVVNGPLSRCGTATTPPGSGRRGRCAPGTPHAPYVR